VPVVRRLPPDPAVPDPADPPDADPPDGAWAWACAGAAARPQTLQ
jgi:hypothetical protein